MTKSTIQNTIVERLKDGGIELQGMTKRDDVYILDLYGVTEFENEVIDLLVETHQAYVDLEAVEGDVEVISDWGNQYVHHQDVCTETHILTYQEVNDAIVQGTIEVKFKEL